MNEKGGPPSFEGPLHESRDAAESKRGPEHEKRPTSEIALWIGRHAEKNKPDKQAEAFTARGKPVPVEDITDQMIELAPQGVVNARGKSVPENAKNAVAYGGPRIRSRQTAGLIMAGAHLDLADDAGAQEMIDQINRESGVKVGTRVGTDQRLDFVLNGSYGERVESEYAAGRLMSYLINHSDEDAEAAGDTESTTYSRAASGVAELVLRYVNASPRWDAIVAEHKKEGDDVGEVLQRFLGTHQSVGESFLAKIIEVTKGEEERDRFIAAVNDSGFGFAEGFQLRIQNHGKSSEPSIHISYIKNGADGKEQFRFEEDLDRELLERIAQQTELAEAA